jgi:hypothetical protein
MGLVVGGGFERLIFDLDGKTYKDNTNVQITLLAVPAYSGALVVTMVELIVTYV